MKYTHHFKDITHRYSHKHKTNQRKMAEEIKNEEISIYFIIFSCVFLLFGIFLFEILNNNFILNERTSSNNKLENKVYCLCCDIWPIKYFHYLRKR